MSINTFRWSFSTDVTSIFLPFITAYIKGTIGLLQVKSTTTHSGGFSLVVQICFKVADGGEECCTTNALNGISATTESFGGADLGSIHTVL